MRTYLDIHAIQCVETNNPAQKITFARLWSGISNLRGSLTPMFFCGDTRGLRPRSDFAVASVPLPLSPSFALESHEDPAQE